MRNWKMYAYKEEDGRFTHMGKESYVKLHMISRPIVEVTVTENPEGEYYGWIREDKSVPGMIWKGKNVFEICFTYGSKAAVEAGQGEIVRLDVEEI